MERPRYKLIWRAERKRFICRWWDADHAEWKDKTLNVTRRRDANEKAQEFLDGLAVEVASSDPLSWLGFRDKYEAEKGPTFAGLSIWKSAARKFEELMNPEWLSDVTPANLSTFQAKMRKAGLRPASIETYLKYIRAAVNWAEHIELITKAPRVWIPKSDGERRARGRAVTGEELDRWLSKLLDDVGEKRFPSWRHLMIGLNLSGLRLGEAFDVWWDKPDMIIPLNIDGRRPVWQFPARLHKSRKETLCPMTPDFVEFLRSIPKKRRRGPLFSPQGQTRAIRSPDFAGRTISEAGDAAKIVVNHVDGEPVYATAHDLRRTFGDRWAARVMPAVLKELMRHASIETTLKYYVGRSAEQTADLVWQAAVTSQGGKTGGNRSLGGNSQETQKSKNT